MFVFCSLDNFLRYDLVVQLPSINFMVFLVRERKAGECGTAIEELRNSVDELEIKKGLYHYLS